MISRCANCEPVANVWRRALADPQANLEGSLVSQMRRCGKEGCRCAQGELHGPYVYLSISRDAQRRLVYIPAELAEVVRDHVSLTEQIEGNAGGYFGHQSRAA